MSVCVCRSGEVTGSCLQSQSLKIYCTPTLLSGMNALIIVTSPILLPSPSIKLYASEEPWPWPAVAVPTFMAKLQLWHEYFRHRETSGSGDIRGRKWIEDYYNCISRSNDGINKAERDRWRGRYVYSKSRNTYTIAGQVKSWEPPCLITRKFLHEDCRQLSRKLLLYMRGERESSLEWGIEATMAMSRSKQSNYQSRQRTSTQYS